MSERKAIKISCRKSNLVISLYFISIYEDDFFFSLEAEAYLVLKHGERGNTWTKIFMGKKNALTKES